MDHLEKAKAIAEWQETMEAMEEHQNKLAEFFRCAFDAPLFKSIALMQSKYTKAVAASVGDENDWLLWYWMDNDFGRGSLNAVFDGVRYPARTAGELATVIERHIAADIGT